jgi:hypothetical protein
VAENWREKLLTQGKIIRTPHENGNSKIISNSGPIIII